MCTPTHIQASICVCFVLVFVCIVYLHLYFVLLGLPVYRTVALGALSSLLPLLLLLSRLHNSHTRTASRPTKTSMRLSRCVLSVCVRFCVTACVWVHLLWLAFGLLKVVRPPARKGSTHTHIDDRDPIGNCISIARNDKPQIRLAPKTYWTTLCRC